MGFIGSMIAAFIVFTLLSMIGGRLKRIRHDDFLQSLGRGLQIAAWPILAVWVVIHSLAAAAYEIPAGNVGVVYEFGAIRGQISEGFQLVTPWRTVTVANIQVQGHNFDNLESFSEETQDVFVDATLNIRVAPEAIQQLYRTVGHNFFEVLVKPRVAQNFKDEIVKFKSVNIAPNREQIRRAVSSRLEKELAPYSIEIVDLLLNNIDFDEKFKEAIESKQIATQRALEEEQKVLVERHRAEQAVEKAKGEGAAILVVAEKQAEANRKLNESLTPTLIQWAMVQKLSDRIHVALLPVGQNFILDSSILNPEGVERREARSQ